MDSEGKLPAGFTGSTVLPSTAVAGDWQRTNREWWENHPMRYDWNERVTVPEFSRQFFEEIDRRFFSDSWHYMPWKNAPFEEILPFDRLPRWDVLEIGMGSGSHAQLLASRSKSYTGI